MLGGKCLILVRATMEFLEPDVATHMEIGSLVVNAIILAAHPLLYDTTLQDKRCGTTVAAVILKLSDTEQRGIRRFKPANRLHDTEVVRASTAR